MGMSPQGQAAWNEKERRRLQEVLRAIISGDTAEINRAITYDLGSDTLNEYKGTLRQIAHDYVNFGGLLPQTKAALVNFKPGGGHTTQKPERDMVDRYVRQSFKYWFSRLPTVTQVPAGVQVKMPIPVGDIKNPGTYLKQYVTNEALRYLDPITAQETRQYLAQANPAMFKAYGMMKPPTDQTPLAQGPTAEQLNTIANTYDWNKLRASLPAPVNQAIAAGGKDIGQPLAWMQNYLRTAASGIGATRAQQQLVAGQLARMNEEAASNKGLAQYRALAENLVNPVLKQASLSDTIGQGRALSSPSGSFRRGGLLRNPFLT